MKTKLNRFGKSSLSIVLAVMMLFSSMIAASNQTVDAAERAIEAATGVSAEQDAAAENNDSAQQPEQTTKAVTPKKTPEKSGDASYIYFANNQGWAGVYAHQWSNLTTAYNNGDWNNKNTATIVDVSTSNYYRLYRIPVDAGSSIIFCNTQGANVSGTTVQTENISVTSSDIGKVWVATGTSSGKLTGAFQTVSSNSLEWYVEGGYGITTTSGWNTISTSYKFTQDSTNTSLYKYITGRTVSDLSTTSNRNPYYYFASRWGSSNWNVYQNYYVSGVSGNYVCTGANSGSSNSKDLANAGSNITFKNASSNTGKYVTFCIDTSETSPSFYYELTDNADGTNNVVNTTTHTIYFDNTDLGWSTSAFKAYIYSKTSGGSVTNRDGAWGSETATVSTETTSLTSNTIYKIEFDVDSTADLTDPTTYVFFHNSNTQYPGSGGEGYIYAEGHVYNASGDTGYESLSAYVAGQTETAQQQSYTVYFDNKENPYDEVYAYPYVNASSTVANGGKIADWPGVEMTYDSTKKLYSATFNLTHRPTADTPKIMFSNHGIYPNELRDATDAIPSAKLQTEAYTLVTGNVYTPNASANDSGTVLATYGTPADVSDVYVSGRFQKKVGGTTTTTQGTGSSGWTTTYSSDFKFTQVNNSTTYKFETGLTPAELTAQYVVGTNSFDKEFFIIYNDNKGSHRYQISGDNNRELTMSDENTGIALTPYSNRYYADDAGNHKSLIINKDLIFNDSYTGGTVNLFYDISSNVFWFEVTGAHKTLTAANTNNFDFTAKSVSVGSTQKVRILNTPSKQVVDAVTLTYNSGETLTATAAGNGYYSFEMPDYDATISVTFRNRKTFTVSTAVNNSSLGSVVVSSSTVKEGDSVAVQANPAYVAPTDNNSIDFTSWAVTGTGSYADGYSSTDSYIEYVPTSNVTFTATFTETATASYVSGYRVVYSYTTENPDNWADGQCSIGKIKKDSNDAEYFEVDFSSNSKVYFTIISGTTFGASKVINNTSTLTDSTESVYSQYLKTMTKGSANLNQNTDDKGTVYRITLEKKSGFSGSVRVYITDGAANAKTFKAVPRVSTLTTASTGGITVYAKDGTIRDGYQKYASFADTTITSVVDIDGETVTSQRTYSNSTYYQKVSGLEAGDVITIRTKLDNGYFNKYYVKAFCINGVSHSLYGENEEPAVGDNARTTGTYSMEYTVTGEDTYLEITPIYFFLENGGDYSNLGFIRFRVENFTGDVQKEWGNTISCQVWYTNGRENNANGEDGGYKNALGGYPGQPLISSGTYYYTQVPKSIPGNSSAGSVTVQGMTLNNYYWDSVHKDLAGKDSKFKGVNNTRSGNAINSQSYDYNDFAALAKMGANDIIFTMKYETKTANKDTNSTSVSAYQNGFHGFVDYFDRGIDLFGHILHNDGTHSFSNVPNGYATTYWDYDVTKTYSEGDIEGTTAFANNQKLWIVSRGYQAIKNTYNGYYGNYATVWDIYTRNGDTLTKVGSLPGSCLIPNATLYETVDGTVYGDLPTSSATGDNLTKYNNNKALFLSFCSTETARSSAANAYFDTFVSLYNNYRGVPAMISYEKAIAEGGVQNDMGLRSDGRWYYSAANVSGEAVYPINANPAVAADLRIQFRDLKTGSTTEYNQAFTTETLTLTDGKAVGESTGAKVWFTDPSTGAAIITDDDSNNRLKVSADFSDEDSFVFKADSLVVSNGKVYAFRGWQVELADITPLNSDDETSTTGSALRNANNSFIARYEQIVATDTVIVSHEMLKTNSTDTTAKSGGSGTTYVSVEVQTSSGGHVYTYPTTDGTIPIDPAYLTEALGYKFKITLSNELDETSHFVDSYESDGKTELSSQTFTLTRSEIFAAKDTNNIVKYLTDFAVNTLSISFNYYDRPDSGVEEYEDVNFPREITINVNYENGQTTDKIIAAAMTGNANAADENSMVAVGNIQNIMDNYKFWTTQNKAATEFAKLDNLRSGTTYGSTENVQTAYHTDCHGNPVILSGSNYYYGKVDDEVKITSISDSYKWVSYTLVDGASLDANGDQTDPSMVTKVTLWAFNYPKEYVVKYHYPKSSNSELAVLVSGSTINEDEETNLPTNVYFVDSTDNTNPIATVTSYYQQRVGAATNDEEIRRAYLTPAKKTEFRNFVNDDDNLTQEQKTHIAELNEDEDAIAEYRDTLYEAKCTEYINEQKELIDGAGGHISQYGVSIGYVGAKYTGGALVDGTGEIRAASVAKYDTGEKDEDQNAIYGDLVFDGWYDAATGKKVSSSELYGYRINVGMNLYAGYVVEEKINTNIGVTVTQLEDDNYIVDVAGGTYQERTRYNTQLNVYNSADNNSSITDTAVVYVQLPITSEHTTEWWAGQFANDATLTESLRNSIQTNLSSGITNGKLTVRGEEITWSSNTVSATVNESGFAYSTSSLALDNKNSVHYTVSFRDDLIEEGKANSAIVVFAGIKYNGNWIVSENAANHINADVPSSGND